MDGVANIVYNEYWNHGGEIACKIISYYVEADLVNIYIYIYMIVTRVHLQICAVACFTLNISDVYSVDILPSVSSNLASNCDEQISFCIVVNSHRKILVLMKLRLNVNSDWKPLLTRSNRSNTPACWCTTPCFGCNIQTSNKSTTVS